MFAPTATLNMDVAAFLTKWGDDVLDAQSPEGAYSDVAPRLALERDGAPAWADAGVIVPWTPDSRYGDLRLLERHWTRWSATWRYLQRHNPDLLWTARRGNDYGDWLAVGAETPQRRARHRVLGVRRRADGARWPRALGARRPRRALRATCGRGSSPPSTDAYVGEDGLIEGDTQTAYLLALAHGSAAGRAARSGRPSGSSANIERHDWHLTTGFVGVGLLCPVLTELGYARRRLPAAAQRDLPLLGLLDPPRRDHDLGALGRLDRGATASRPRR